MIATRIDTPPGTDRTVPRGVIPVYRYAWHWSEARHQWESELSSVLGFQTMGMVGPPELVLLDQVTGQSTPPPWRGPSPGVERRSR